MRRLWQIWLRKETKNPPPSEQPEVKKLPAAKPNKALALEMAARGMSAAEIAKQTGMNYNTVYYYLNPKKCAKKRKPKAIAEKSVKDEDKVMGWNADRHACQTCQYRAEGHKGCDYYILTDEERGGDPADCVKYIEGDRISKQTKEGA